MLPFGLSCFNQHGLYQFLWHLLVIKFDDVRCMDLVGVFPGIVTLRVALPFDQILPDLVAPPVPMGADLFYFVLFFSIDQIQWWSCEVRTVGRCFSVQRD